MKAHRAAHSITTLCRVLGVSASGYYAWVTRRLSERARQDAALLEQIRAFHQASRGTYGTPRIHRDLRAAGVRVGRKRVARLLKQAGLRGVSRRKWVQTTVRSEHGRPAPDLVQRQFAATAPNQLWVADSTYVPTWAGLLYLAVVLDVWSRRVMAGRWRRICEPSWCWPP
jgi:putative transposase